VEAGLQQQKALSVAKTAALVIFRQMVHLLVCLVLVDLLHLVIIRHLRVSPLAKSAELQRFQRRPSATTGPVERVRSLMERGVCSVMLEGT